VNKKWMTLGLLQLAVLATLAWSIPAPVSAGPDHREQVKQRLEQQRRRPQQPRWRPWRPPHGQRAPIVPELDPNAAGQGLALLAGAALLFRTRSRSATPSA
jgi:hypothetical protein